MSTKLACLGKCKGAAVERAKSKNKILFSVLAEQGVDMPLYEATHLQTPSMLCKQQTFVSIVVD
ncbi:MAG: hypothetical protein ACNYNY_04850 [Candidatus Oxydemutatoraceae bacterium WSBS_2016_MAG_OTU14]